MKYALIGDIHSSQADLEKVLTQINEVASGAVIVGTGDLFECTVSKKDITDCKFSSLAEVMINDDALQSLLTFPTVYGNQEERVLLITETLDPIRAWMAALPETMAIEGAEVIHGHQWTWGGEPWSLMQAETTARLTFYGHSHTVGLSINGERQVVEIGTMYDVAAGEVLVNVGAVVGTCEWVLYDAAEQTVQFMKA